MKIYLTLDGLQTATIPPGKYVLIQQWQNPNDIKFTVHDTEPPLEWATGIYKVLHDGTLEHIKSDYDSSD